MLVNYTKIRYSSYIIILVIGIIIRFSSPLTLLLDADSAGYLTPALNFFITGDFDHSCARSYPYPLFLTVLLFISKNINSVCLVQHLLSMVSFIVLINTIERYWLKDKNNFIPTFLSVFFCGLIYLDGNIIIFEKTLRPEGLSMPSLILLLSFITVFFSKSENKYRFLSFIFCVFLLFIFSLMHARLLASFLVTIALLNLFMVQQLNLLSHKLLALMLTIIIGFSCYYPEGYLINKYDKTAPVFSLVQFFYSNAPTVLIAVEDGFTVWEDMDKKHLKEDIINELNDEEGKKFFPVLSYNMDKLQYETFGNRLSTNINFNDTIFQKERFFNSYYSDWFKILIFHYPIEIMKKTGKQMMFVLFSKHNNFVDYIPLKHTQVFTENLTVPLRYLKNSLQFIPNQVITPGSLPGLLFLIRLISIPLRALFLISLMWSVILIYKRSIPNTLLIMFQILLLYFLTVSLFHSFDLGRYLVCMSPLIYLFIYYSLLSIYEIYTRKRL